MRKFTDTRLFNCKDSNDFDQLFLIFTATLNPGMSKRLFTAYYAAEGLEYIDVTFIREDEKVIGFCSAAFYKIAANGRPYTVGRAAVGILPEYRGGALPVSKLFYKFIRYKQNHPFANLILTGYLANPLIFDLVKRYVGRAYPIEGKKMPQKIARLYETSVAGKSKDPNRDTQVVKLHFHVKQGPSLLKRVMESKSRFVKYFLSKIPVPDGRYGLVVIVPVTWANIASAIAKLFFRKIRKGFRKSLNMTYGKRTKTGKGSMPEIAA